MTTQSRNYLSYLLRLWRAGGGERGRWRASIESPITHERLGFASLAELFAFLETQVEAAGPAPTDEQAQADTQE